MSTFPKKSIVVFIVALTVSVCTVYVFAQESKKRSGPSQYIKSMQQVNRANFVSDFLRKKAAIDDMLMKQKFYAKMLVELEKSREGVDEVIRQEKRAILQQELNEINKTVTEFNSKAAQ